MDTCGHSRPHVQIIFADTEANCKTSPVGIEYGGTKSVTEKGERCIDWVAVKNATLAATLNVIDASDAGNYCRRLADTAWDSISCVVEHDSGRQFEQPCHIEFCRMIACKFMACFLQKGGNTASPYTANNLKSLADQRKNKTTQE